jgi:hypothetical protein
MGVKIVANDCRVGRSNRRRCRSILSLGHAGVTLHTFRLIEVQAFTRRKISLGVDKSGRMSWRVQYSIRKQRDVHEHQKNLGRILNTATSLIRLPTTCRSTQASTGISVAQEASDAHWIRSVVDEQVDDGKDNPAAG